MKKREMAILTSVLLLVSIFFQALPLKAVAFSQGSEEIKGSLVIVGGALGSTNKDIYNKFIELGGGSQAAKIGIIPAASTNLKSSNSFKADLIGYGVPEANITILPIALKDDSKTPEDESKWIENVDKDELVASIKSLTAIWFVGGDQERITKCLLRQDGTNTKALDAIWEIYKNGAVLGGTSAGAAIMSNSMMLGGDSLGALNEGIVSPDTDLEKYEFEPAMVISGLGFFKYGMVDQHFDKRARYGRLIVTAWERTDRKNFAYGIDENTAMVVNNRDKTAEVLGVGGITIIDLSKAVKNPGSKALDMSGIKLNYITQGDLVKLDKNEIQISNHKDTTGGYEYYDFKSPSDTGVLTGHGLFRDFLSYNLVDNAGSDSVTSYAYDSKGRGFRLSFKKTDETQGYWGYKDRTLDDYSFTNVVLDISPVRVSIKPENNSAKYTLQSFERTVVDASDIKGSLVIVGGALGSSTEDIYMEFMGLAGGEKAKIGIIPAASSSLSSSKKFKEDLVSYGIPEDRIEIIPIANKNDKSTPEDESKWIENANKQEVADSVKTYTGIWFVGGDQTRITSCLLNPDKTNTLVLDSIWDMYKNGGVLGGTSAGAAIMSDIMIGGGDSLGALNSGFTNDYSSSDQQEYGPVYLEKGLGFFRYGIVDQHFNAKARLGRLVMTAYEKGDRSKLSFGIDENTAMVVDNQQGTMKVLGKGGVTVVDVSRAEKNLESKRTDLKNVIISSLAKGDSMSLKNGEFTIGDHKDTTVGYEYGYYTPTAVTGIFSSHNTVKDLVSYDLIDNEKATKVVSYCFDENGEGSEILFREIPESEGFWGYRDGNMDDYSFINIAMDIMPINVEIKNLETKLSLDRSSADMKIGESLKLVSSLSSTSFESKDSSIASVGADGTVSAIKEGQTTVTAISSDGNAFALFTVKVSRAASVIELPRTGTSGVSYVLYAAGLVLAISGLVLVLRKRRLIS